MNSIAAADWRKANYGRTEEEEEEEFIYHKYTYRPTSNFRLIHDSDWLPEKQ